MRISDWSSDVCSSDLGEYQADGYFRTDFHSSQLSGQSRRFVVMTRLDDLARAVEATLFASDKPLSIMEIRHYAGGEGDVATALEKLADHYAERGVHLVERGGHWHFQTAPDLAHILRKERGEPRRLSRAAMDTLALIAYHEPVSRAAIAAIRVVQAIGRASYRERGCQYV